MVGFYGDYDTTETVIIPFNTFSSDDPSASVTITDLAAADIEIHKDGSTTQRSSDNGVTVTINFDSITGNHIVSIDLSDNTDAGFYAAGSRYQVRMEGTTVDGATINAWIGHFSIGKTQAAMTAALVAHNLDHLCLTATAAADMTTEVADNTILSRVLANGDTSAFVPSTDGLQPIRDHIGDGTNLTEAGGDGDHLTEAGGDGDHLIEVQVADGSMVAASYAADAFAAATFATGALTADAFAADAIVAATFATGAISADAFAADAIVAATLATDSITSDAFAASAATKIIDEFETQSQADPTGFHVNVYEIGDTAQTANDNGADINAILTDTNELQGDWTNGGRLDLILDATLAMLDDARTEPGQGAPPVNPDAMTKLDYLYKFLRNKIETTATTISVYDDAGSTVDQKSTIADNDTTFTRGEFGTGP